MHGCDEGPASTEGLAFIRAEGDSTTTSIGVCCCVSFGISRLGPVSLICFAACCAASRSRRILSLSLSRSLATESTNFPTFCATSPISRRERDRDKVCRRKECKYCEAREEREREKLGLCPWERFGEPFELGERKVGDCSGRSTAIGLTGG